MLFLVVGFILGCLLGCLLGTSLASTGTPGSLRKPLLGEDPGPGTGKGMGGADRLDWRWLRELPSGFSRMRRDELSRLAEERGLDVRGFTRDEILTALRSWARSRTSKGAGCSPKEGVPMARKTVGVQAAPDATAES